MNTLAAETASAWYLTLKGNPHRRSCTDGESPRKQFGYHAHICHASLTPGDRTGLRWRGCHNSTASFRSVRRRVPPKSLAGREEVSLSPRAVIAPDVPPSGSQRPLIAPKQLVHHLLAVPSSRRPALAHTRVMYLFCRVFGCQRSAKEKSPS